MILTNAIGFDVKAWDPGAPVVPAASGTVALMPGDPGYNRLEVTGSLAKAHRSGDHRLYQGARQEWVVCADDECKRCHGSFQASVNSSQWPGERCSVRYNVHPKRDCGVR